VSRAALLLIGLVGCGPVAPAPDPVPWCLVQTKGLAAAEDVAPRVQPAAGLQVIRGPVDEPADWYRDNLWDTRKTALPVGVTGAPLAEGRWLVGIHGASDWWETSEVILLLDRSGGRSRVRAANIRWNADVPPYSGWAAIDGDAIRIDDRAGDVVRIAFRLTGDIATASVAVDGARQHERVEGAVSVTLVPGALAPPDPSILEALAPFLSGS
jgi:hypothetical protein